MRRVVILLPFLFALVACAPQRASRTLEATLSADGVTTLITHADIGSVTVTPSTDANVHVSVKLEPSNNFFWDIFTHSKAPEAIRAATITHTLDRGALDFSVQYPANSGADAVNEEWSIAVPAKLHVKSHINIGKLEVTGIGGGVEAQMNIGKVMLDVPGGPLEVSVNVGKITAQAHTTDYGSVALAANIGDTHLTVDGLSVGGTQKQGTGSQINYQGKGSDAISLKTNTGKVSLSLQTQAQPAAAKN
ncbi:MAG: hypothetical protein ACRETO_01985 [Gammaproteobacteria bacterium]